MEEIGQTVQEKEETMNTHEKTFLRSPWLYFAATYLWSWGLCGILILKDMSGAPALSFLILILAMIGPGVTGILFIYLTRSKKEIREYWTRIIDVKRLALPWVAIAMGLPFILQVMAGVIDGLTGGIGLRWGESAAAFIANPVNQLLTLCIISLVPFFEELGWRGYAQDLLQEKRSALSASLILGCVWSLWHLPASFIPKTYQAGLGIGTLEFWLHFGGIIVLSVVISWIYINTNRSILVMAVFHAMINLSGELLELSKMGETVYTFCWVSAAIAIVFGFGKDMRVNPEKSRDVRWSMRSNNA
jgi:membrane protease YdiL (CAAX protease family)